MAGHVASMHLSDHSAGCPTSPAQPLWLPDNPETCLLAFGCQAGSVTVHATQVNGYLQGQARRSSRHLAQYETHYHVLKETSGTDGKLPSKSENILARPIVLRFSSTAKAVEEVTTVAWCSQGVESRLAAIAGDTVAVFQLEQYITGIIQHTPASQAHSGQTAACQALHSCALVALSWTQEGDGLLSADAHGDIIMWRITSSSDGSEHLTQAWVGGSSTVVQPQTVLTAGAKATSPSASACPGSKQVTIWWPEDIQQDGSGSAVNIPEAKDADAPAVAEQLRHPVGVVAAQWSPGFLQHGQHSPQSCCCLLFLVSQSCNKCIN